MHDVIRSIHTCSLHYYLPVLLIQVKLYDAFLAVRRKFIQGKELTTF